MPLRMALAIPVETRGVAVTVEPGAPPVKIAARSSVILNG